MIAGTAETAVAGHPFCESEYLEMNADVRAAVRAGQFTSGRDHFVRFGLREGRLGRTPAGLATERFFGEQEIDVAQIRSFRAENFPYRGPHPWLDQPDWEHQLNQRLRQGELEASDAHWCRQWARDGYVIIENCIPPALLDAAWAAYDRAIAEGRVKLPPAPAGDPLPERFLDPHTLVPELCGIMRHPEILRLIGILMNRTPSPFQTIASHKGSQQREHSDSIHMTTYPLGYLTASWTAFEDIHPDSGPLVYYPGSHRLPYIFSQDVGIDDAEFGTNGYRAYHERYEPKIRQILDEHGMKRQHFLAKKGDVLIWHANLIHGGSARRDLRLTRKAVVSHYFVQGAVTYHDLSGMPARGHTGTCIVQ